jgi:NADPH-dependent glutamate synthase beta subunit-like oxidoreductase/Pyruvate/2-oxoacid:ferredoxin oxidoreductase delta subunit
VSDRGPPSYHPRQREKQAPCQLGCASSGDVRGWLAIVAQRGKTKMSRDSAYEAAWRKITEANPLPATLGRICPHPCEDACNRSDHDGPIAVHRLERFLGDYAIEQGWALDPEDTTWQPWSVGVIGSGPGGLSFAYQMARRGYRVTVYDAHPQAGGMLRYGVPDFRLPRSVLDAEIHRITQLGVELSLECRIGRDISLDSLRDRHDALYLAPGAQKGVALGIAGMKGPGCWTGVAFLQLIEEKRDVRLGRATAVIGGGNSALDAARAARRQGADVKLLYRRGEDDMPAFPDEIREAREEGVEVIPWIQPVQVERGPGQEVRALLVCQTQPGPEDGSGRPRPVPVVGSEFLIEVDSVISAVSQVPELEGFGTDGTWLKPGPAGELGDGLWAGGDVLGLGIAGSAIAQGRRAAEAVHQQLSGVQPDHPKGDQPTALDPGRIRFAQHDKRAPAQAVTLDGVQRLADSHAESERTLDERQFLTEVERCLSCGACSGCNLCAMYCTSDCFMPVETPTAGNYFILDTEACRACGKCIELCPAGYLEEI